MADTFITLVSGVKKLREFITTSAGAGDSGKGIALDAAGKLDSSFMPAGLGADSLSVVASETISGNTEDALVNLWNDGGTIKVRNADATAAGKEVHGFVKDDVTATNSVTVYFDGDMSGFTGLTPAAILYMSETPGDVTETAPTATGNVIQQIGIATSSTTAEFERGDPIEIE